jgi:hypothetical protein
MNRGLIILLILVVTSCGEDSALKVETLNLADENRDWITPDKYGNSFVLMDNNKISQGFSMYQNSSDFSPSTTSYFGIRTRLTKTESFTQAWSSNFGQSIMLILTAGFEPFGDRFSISVNGLNFMYDFKFETIGHIYFDSGSKSKTMTDTGYVETDTIFSVVDLQDTLTVHGVKYTGILHFRLEDFKDQWTDFTVREICLAKNVGLIKYTLNNGIVYERK